MSTFTRPALSATTSSLKSNINNQQCHQLSSTQGLTNRLDELIMKNKFNEGLKFIQTKKIYLSESISSYYSSIIFFKLNDFDKSLQFAHKMMTIDKVNPDGYILAMKVFEKRIDLQNALKVCEQALKSISSTHSKYSKLKATRKKYKAYFSQKKHQVDATLATSSSTSLTDAPVAAASVVGSVDIASKDAHAAKISASSTLMDRNGIDESNCRENKKLKINDINNETSAFAMLPYEIKYLIFSRLSNNELIKARWICSSIKSYIENDSRLFISLIVGKGSSNPTQIQMAKRLLELAKGRFQKVVIHRNTNVINHVISRMSEFKYPSQLSTLNLTEISKFPSSFQKYFLPKFCGTLVNVDFSGSLVDDRSIQILLKLSKSLNKLNFTGCEFVTDACLSSISPIENQSTSTNGSSTGKDNLIQPTSYPAHQSLKSLLISGTKLTKDAISVLASCFLNLEELDLSKFTLDINAFSHLSELTCLTKIVLNEIQLVPNRASAFIELASSLFHPRSNLVKVSMISVPSVNFEICSLLSQLPKLKTIYLEGCPNIDDECVRCFTRCPELIDVNFNNCFRITDVGLCELIQTCTKLKRLFVGNTQTSNSLLKSLKSHAKSIMSLDISRSPQIDSIGIKTLLEQPGIHKRLIYLNLTYCQYVTYEIIKICKTFVPKAKIEVKFSD